MIIYHGGTDIIENPKIITQEKGRDFGFAFYTTDIKEQAERWAIRRAKLLSKFNKIKVEPIINIYEYSENNKELNIKSFENPNEEWLDMILKCRSDITYKHNFDIVIGKIANDNVGETVSFVLEGIMRKEDAIERLKFQKINRQLAFCTEKSLKQLKFIKSYVLEL